MTPFAAPSEVPTGPTGTYVARTPVDLIALVPFVLGFHPADSVVLLTFGSPHGSFHARVDLPHGPGDRAEVVGLLSDAVAGNRATSAVVLAFTHDHEAACRVGRDLVPALLETGAEVIDAIRVEEGRWWPVGPVDVGPPGPGHAYDLSTHPFTAARVLDGHAAFADRASLAASLRPGRSDAALVDRIDITRAADVVADELRGPGAVRLRRDSAHWLVEELSALVGRSDAIHPDGPGPTVEVAARIGVLAQLPDLRHAVMTTLDRPGAATQLRVWRDLLVRMPDELVPGVAAVLALVAWLAGDGALAWCAIDRCEECADDDDDEDDDERGRTGLVLADHVASLLRGACPPDTWRAPDRPVRTDRARALPSGP